MNWKEIWVIIKRYIVNKYVISFLLFAVCFTFCGNHSLIRRIQQQRKIRELNSELKEYRQQTEEAQEALREINSSPENLERFARETYYMKTPEEDVYLVEE